MAFMQNNGFGGNNSNNNGGEKKKENFSLGRIYGPDGQLNIGLWINDRYGTFATLSIKSAIGKDPSTGGNVYENKMSGELPTVRLNTELTQALVSAIEACDGKYEELNGSISTARGNKLTFAGSNTEVKVTIEDPKSGSRTITLKSMSIGNRNIHPSVQLLYKYLNRCLTCQVNKKALPDENADESDNTES